MIYTQAEIRALDAKQAEIEQAEARLREAKDTDDTDQIATANTQLLALLKEYLEMMDRKTVFNPPFILN